MIREPIYAALFALVWNGEVFGNPEADARTLKHWSEVPREQMPALFMAQGKQPVARSAANGLPTVWQPEATLYIYVTRTDDLSPGEVLNPILDAIEAALAPNAIGTPQTLGGLVQWARIEGAIDTSEGTLGDLEVAIIPIRMLAA